MKLWRSAMVVCAFWSACAGVEREEQEQSWRIEELERAVVLLRGEKQELEREVELLRGATGLSVCFVHPVPKVDANVLEVVFGHPLVWLDAGSAEGVRDGYCFAVYVGTTFKGQVKAVKVEEHRTLAVVVGEKHPIAAGDSASTGI